MTSVVGTMSLPEAKEKERLRALAMARRRMSVKLVGVEDDDNKDSLPPNPPELDGVPDMSMLIYLEEPHVVHNLKYNFFHSTCFFFFLFLFLID